MGHASLRRCEVYAIEPESLVSAKPRANPVCVATGIARARHGTRAAIEYMLRYQELVMEATSGLEPE
jgi:hypothetical protein